MRLLVLSHPCVTAINQQFFATVEAVSGWDVDIVVPARWRNDYGAVLRPGRWPGFRGRLIEIPVLRSGSIPLHWYRSSMVQLLRRLLPDVIYAHHEPYAVATMQLYAANSISLRRPIGFYSAQNINKRYPLPFRLGERFVYRESVFALPVSRSVEDVLRSKGYQGAATVMPLGIDPLVYRPHPDAAALAGQLRRGTAELLIGYLGRLTEEKGLGTLLEGLSSLHALPWRLAVVGAGDYCEKFMARAAALGLESRIDLIGFVPHTEAPRYLSAFDLLVLPSESRPNWKEQFGRVIVEALACGTPVIGSDSGEIPFVIKATGGGLVFREGEPSDLARAIQELAAPERRRELVVTGQANGPTQFRNSCIAANFIQTISRAVGAEGM